MYILVTSFSPLEVFIYKEGFARFCIRKYSSHIKDIHDERVHLTNSSIQKFYFDDIEDDHPVKMAKNHGEGNKCTISWLLYDYFIKQGVDPSSLWKAIKNICLKALVAVDEDAITFQPNSFELYGFDIILDENLRPWLIEVNASPSLARETYLDKIVKERLFSDTIRLVDPPSIDRKALISILERRLATMSAKKTMRSTYKYDQNTTSYVDKDQLETDLRNILNSKLPRAYGEMPSESQLGLYERISPNKDYVSCLKCKKKLLQVNS